jgi:hyperosmotically inducible periplasmic protein
LQIADWGLGDCERSVLELPSAREVTFTRRPTIRRLSTVEALARALIYQGMSALPANGGWHEEASVMLKKPLLMALAFALVSTSAFAEVNQRKSLQIVNDISSEVRKYTRFTIFDDVRVGIAEGGVAVVTGRVTMPFKKDDIGRIVGRVDGVSSVRNELGVLPVSPYDDDLRYRIARAIYGNSNFSHYAAMASPPIHIIVERGHVTLTGVVNSNVERMVARSLATTFGAFSVKNELKTDAEVQLMAEKL